MMPPLRKVLGDLVIERAISDFWEAEARRPHECKSSYSDFRIYAGQNGGRYLHWCGCTGPGYYCENTGTVADVPDVDAGEEAAYVMPDAGCC